MRTQVIIFFSILSCILSAQDPHFSQYNEQPALVNPALTGAIANLRMSVVHKNQWRGITSPFTTYGASFEIRSPGRLKRTGKFGRTKTRTPGLIALGVAVYNDKAANRLTSTTANLNITTFVPLGRRHFISAGIQAGLIQRKLNTSGFVYPDQFTGIGYDPSLIQGEEIPGQTFQYTDYSAGMLYSFGRDIKSFLYHHETRARLGFAVFHVTRPTSQYFNTSTDFLYHKFVGHGEFLRDIEGTHMAWAMSFITIMQGPSREITAGGVLKFYNSNDTKITGYVRRSTFGLGMAYRYADALIFSFQAEIEEQYAIGVSYDITNSALKKSSKRGGLELTFRYTPPNSFLYQKK